MSFFWGGIDAIETIDTIGRMGDFLGGATTDRGSQLSLHCLQAALQASPSLAWSFPRYAISDGGFGGTGWWLWRGAGLVFYDVIALGGEVFFCAGF